MGRHRAWLWIAEEGPIAQGAMIVPAGFILFFINIHLPVFSPVQCLPPIPTSSTQRDGAAVLLHYSFNNSEFHEFIKTNPTEKIKEHSRENGSNQKEWTHYPIAFWMSLSSARAPLECAPSQGQWGGVRPIRFKSVKCGAAQAAGAGIPAKSGAPVGRGHSLARSRAPSLNCSARQDRPSAAPRWLAAAREHVISGNEKTIPELKNASLTLFAPKMQFAPAHDSSLS